MKSLKVHVDFSKGNVGPCARLAGLTVFERTCRTLTEAGIEVVAHHVDSQCKVPDGVEISTDSPPEDSLDGMVLINAEKLNNINELSDIYNAVTMQIHTWADLDRAERHLWESLRKPIERDGVVAYYLVRPVSRFISRALIPTPVTPNQVTVLAGLSGLLAAVIVPFSLSIGAILLWFSNVLDCVDGEIARLKMKGSRLGQWLDTIGDDLVYAFYPLGLALLMGGGLYMVVALLGSVLYMGSALIIYADLAKRPVVDTAMFPWFFLGEGGAASGQSKNLGHYLAYLVRRDVVITIHLLLGILGLPLLSYLLQILLNYGQAFLMATDLAVKFRNTSRDDTMR